MKHYRIVIRKNGLTMVLRNSLMTQTSQKQRSPVPKYNIKNWQLVKQMIEANSVKKLLT